MFGQIGPQLGTVAAIVPKKQGRTERISLFSCASILSGDPRVDPIVGEQQLENPAERLAADGLHE